MIGHTMFRSDDGELLFRPVRGALSVFGQFVDGSTVAMIVDAYRFGREIVSPFQATVFALVLAGV